MRMNNTVKVLLPAWVFRRAGDDKQKIRQNVLQYMNKSYPDYTVIKVQGKFAICERGLRNGQKHN